jgi:hypothetical protein
VTATALSRLHCKALRMACLILPRLPLLLSSRRRSLSRGTAVITHSAQHTSHAGCDEVAPPAADVSLLREAALQFTKGLVFEGLEHPRERERCVVSTLEDRIYSVCGGGDYVKTARESLSVFTDVAEKDPSLLGRLSRCRFTVFWAGVRTVSFLQALSLLEGGRTDHLKQALSTWPPSGVDKIKSPVSRLRIFIAHAMHSPTPLSPFLYSLIVAPNSPFAEYFCVYPYGVEPGSPDDPAPRVQAELMALARALSEMAQGSSPRTALRNAFPCVALTPAATRTLLELKTPLVERYWSENLCSPLELLRYAQIKAMLPNDRPFVSDCVGLLSTLLLPKSICSTAAEEDYWLRAARFVVERLPEQSAFSRFYDEEEEEAIDLELLLANAQTVEWWQLNDWQDVLEHCCPVLCDLAFYLSSKFQAACADGSEPPPGFAPWAGMTLRTLGARAVAHCGAAPLGDLMNGRMPQTWPSASASQLASIREGSGEWEGEALWTAIHVVCTCDTAGESTVPGTWRAHRLITVAEVRREGFVQNNCLATWSSGDSDANYELWSLRFSAADGAPLPSEAIERVTVLLRKVASSEPDGRPEFIVGEARGRINMSVHRGALNALVGPWAAASGITLVAPRRCSKLYL